jgi:hypothetical protein
MPSPDLNIITATWKTPFSDNLWKKLDSLKAAAPAQDDFVNLGPTLPDDQERRIAEVVVHRDEDEDDLHWILAVRSVPSDEPPDHIRQHDEQLGGRRGLSSLLAEAFPSGAPAVGSFRLRLLFPENEFTCLMIPAAVKKGGGHDAALLLGRDAQLEQVGYRFEGGGAGGIEEVALIYRHQERRYDALVSATGPLKLTAPTWLPFAADVGELVQNTFFSPREVQP